MLPRVSPEENADERSQTPGQRTTGFSEHDTQADQETRLPGAATGRGAASSGGVTGSDWLS